MIGQWSAQLIERRHDIQHNDTQHNDIRHKGIQRNDTQLSIQINLTLSIMTLSITALNFGMMSVVI
jgi:hypothetical protein